MNRSVTTSMKKGYIMKTGLEDVFASGCAWDFFGGGLPGFSGVFLQFWGFWW